MGRRRFAAETAWSVGGVPAIVRALAISGLLAIVVAASFAWATDGVREPAVAGRFYPGTARALRGAVEAFLDEARVEEACRDHAPLALVAPHAGYIFSGQIAADAWNQAEGHDYDLIVILGTNHTVPGFEGVSVYDGAGYRTPLGVAEIDRVLADRLRDADPAFTFRRAVHEREHSVEIHVPFAQVLFPEVPLVAAVVGTPDAELCDRLGRALIELGRGRKMLVVASSDLSHYPQHDVADRVDGDFLRALQAGDGDGLLATVERELRRGHPGLSTCACGLGPVLTVMAMGAHRGPHCNLLISYANSGDTALGELDRVVGYGAAAILAGDDHRGGWTPLSRREPTGEISSEDQRRLLVFARESVRRYLTTETTPLARDLGTADHLHRGAFVTLKKEGHLRGCIGHMVDDRPLGQVVGAMALQAAFNDRRFEPVTLRELAALEIEISVLNLPVAVAGPEAIRVGTDGVLLRRGDRSAVFLPQVATEQGWDRTQLLDALCRKAGLPGGSWREGAEIQIFQAHVFSDAEFP